MKEAVRWAGIAELRRLRTLEQENKRLKQLVADLSLDKKMLQHVLLKTTLRPAVKCVLVREVQVAYRVAER